MTSQKGHWTLKRDVSFTDLGFSKPQLAAGQHWACHLTSEPVSLFAGGMKENVFNRQGYNLTRDSLSHNLLSHRTTSEEADNSRVGELSHLM